jgi:DNA-binding GntR family transcriptional regulator
MGRGLSDLQKTMLKLSWDEKERFLNAVRVKGKAEDTELFAKYKEWQPTVHYDTIGYAYKHPEFMIFIVDNWIGRVFFSKVYIKVYGWVPYPSDPNNARTYLRPDKFPKKEIGLNKYMTGYMAVKKATDRLVKRGLINIRHGKGYYLTNEGEEIAKLLA